MINEVTKTPRLGWLGARRSDRVSPIKSERFLLAPTTKILDSRWRQSGGGLPRTSACQSFLLHVIDYTFGEHSCDHVECFFRFFFLLRPPVGGLPSGIEQYRRRPLLDDIRVVPALPAFVADNLLFSDAHEQHAHFDDNPSSLSRRAREPRSFTDGAPLLLDWRRAMLFHRAIPLLEWFNDIRA